MSGPTLTHVPAPTRTSRSVPPARHVLVVQHAPWESPGLIDEALGAVGLDGPAIERRTVLDEAEPELPAARDLAGLVVMGGPQDADADVAFPGLAAERRLLAEAVAADVPVLGVCLGMQLLALALGARLHRRHGTEIGFAPVRVVGADPVLEPVGPAPTVLHWHGDAVDLPAGATLLASTDATGVQAFRAGSALGLQFHLEVDRPLLTTWLATAAMVDGVADAEVARMRAEGPAHLDRLAPAARAGLATFAAAVRDRT